MEKEIIVLDRETLKRDWKFLIDYIQKHHVMEPQVFEELFVNHTPVVGLGHERGCFMWIDTDTERYYMQYHMDHIIVDVEKKAIGRSLREVIIYPDYITYEAARIQKLSSVKPGEQTGLNLN